MAKLKCVTHGRRVVVLKSGRQFHRTGDGSRCSGELMIGQVRGDLEVLRKIRFYQKH